MTVRLWPVPMMMVAVAFALTACAGSGGAPARPRSVDLKLPAFTATTPPAPNWILAPAQPEAAAAVRSVGPTHSVVAWTGQREFRETAEPGAAPEALLGAALRTVRKTYEDGRHRLQSFLIDPASGGCRAYRLRAEDTGVPDLEERIYMVKAVGKVCLFPERELIGRIEYSERHLPEEDSLASFEAEADAFFASVRPLPQG